MKLHSERQRKKEGAASEAVRSVELLAERVATVAHEIGAATLPVLPDFDVNGTWIVSGIGASEGTARLLVGELLELGVAASFRPVTAFLGPQPPGGDVLVVVSQRLSPNACIPLHQRARFRTVLVLTSLDPGRDDRCAALARSGVAILRHGPRDEDGLFVRVIGPALASRAALHLAAGVAARRGAAPAWAARVAEIGPAMTRAAARVTPIANDWLFGPSAILAAGDDGALTCGLRTKLLEALGVADPAIWDLCGVVHGPLQSFYESRRLLFVLEPRGDERSTLLRRRLEQIVEPERHRIVVIEAELPPPLAYFEYVAAFDALIVAGLREQPRDLAAWPAKGKDGPIYDVDGESF